MEEAQRKTYPNSEGDEQWLEDDLPGEVLDHRLRDRTDC